MWTRPLSETLIDLAGSLLSVGLNQRVVRATDVEMTLPIDVRLMASTEALVFCADVPAWRWRTEWDRPHSQLQLRLEERSLGAGNEHF